ncbi:hypothetical protein BB560_000226 [Smittium megazygosporum]|uniref:B30.2/SPRY domain-containing protein n=1 Tax=Smittium megazygosporum TaxID=133381 RepID=A0A2T9ZKZ2_9FUNG|nr:hypothetical protein BB560_000226 [Smittium megazygosporum]
MSEPENYSEDETFDFRLIDPISRRLNLSASSSEHDYLLEISLEGEDPPRSTSSGIQNIPTSRYLDSWAEISSGRGSNFRLSETPRSHSRTHARGRGRSFIHNINYLDRLPSSSSARAPLRLLRPSEQTQSSFVTTYNFNDSEEQDLDENDSEIDDSDSENGGNSNMDLDNIPDDIPFSRTNDDEIEKHLSNPSSRPDSSLEQINISPKLAFPKYLLNSSFGKFRESQQCHIDSYLLLHNSELSNPNHSDSHNSPLQGYSDRSQLPVSEPDSSSLSSDSSTIFVSAKSFKLYLEKYPNLMKSLQFPTHWNSSDLNKNIKILPNMLQANYIGSGRDDEDSGMVRTNWPIPSNCGIFYFEVKIVDKGRNGYIGIGFCSNKVALNRLPGWDPDSWGYHGDDGNSFKSNGHGTSYGPKFTTGDTIGCGINFITHEAFFVKNGVNLGVAFHELKPNFTLYPSVGMRTPDEKITANFGLSPFVYDIESYVANQKHCLWEKIMKTSINSIVLSSLLKCKEGPYTNASISYTTTPPVIKAGDTAASVVPNFTTTSSDTFSSTNSSDHNANSTLSNQLSRSNPLLFTSIEESSKIVQENPNTLTPKQVLNELILSYLIHHGYSKSAKAFAKNVIGLNSNLSQNNSDINKDAQIQTFLTLKEQQVSRRKEITDLIRQGNINESIIMIKKYYPLIVNSNKTMFFQLRCQHYVELARIAYSFKQSLSSLVGEISSQAQKSDLLSFNPFDYGEKLELNKIAASNADVLAFKRNTLFNDTSDDIQNEVKIANTDDLFRNSSTNIPKNSTDVPSFDNSNSVMDIDDDIPKNVIPGEFGYSTFGSSSDLTLKLLSLPDSFPDPQYENSASYTSEQTAKALMCYGQMLNLYYSRFNDDYFDSKLDTISLILAFNNPMGHSLTKSLFDLDKRKQIAEMVNLEIVSSEKSLPMSPIEAIYKQTNFCLSTLSESFSEGSSSIICLNQKFS